ncbi:winged helix-turn-helix transcriptional regulator [uncultured Desulfosarcina sp.]|uniref:winged helix-turn-helix transcriptional regulator n=1 Tax=uncultured Desulfosarcina sp. TaxID=218289 RepID=UPI0029C8FA91|nr:winged helix-turn-helix transcriptional regulator [uncultured Desulfosarcina sp.]
MESKSLKTLQLLEAIAADKPTSQRELSDVLQISLGLVNSFIRRLVKKGYCKVTTIPKNRVKYILTPAGAMEKTRLTYEYISSSYHYFKAAQNRLENLYAELVNEGANRVVFYGVGELADIALISMAGTDIRLIDIVDPAKEGEIYANFVVKAVSRLKKTDFDALLITAVDNHEAVLNKIKGIGVPPDKIRFF